MKWHSWLIIPILILGFLVRLYKIDTPLADWHSWRQADTASVAVEYVKHGIDLLRPTYMDISNIPSGKENPQGYRMVEFPLIPALVAAIFNVFPNDLMTLNDIHILFRVVNIMFSLGSIYLIYRIVKLLDSEVTALIAAAVFAFLPYNVYYSRAVLPEVALVFFSLLSVYWHLLRATRYTLLATISAAIALLLKPTAIFYLAPVAGLYFWSFYKKEISPKKLFSYVALLLLSLIPLILWRFWISQFPEGIPANIWLLNGDGIRFKGSWWHWLFAERLGRLILGFWGLIPFGLGILSLGASRFTRHASNIFYSLFLVSCFLYLAIFATGNVRHDYYQIILIPIISILTGKGIMFMISQKTIFSYLLSLFTLLLMLAFGFFEVRGFYNINNPAIMKAGRAVDQLTPENALVIAPYQGDTAFLYQTNRRGWPLGGFIDQRIEQGATHYISTTMDAETQELMNKFEVIDQTEEYILIQLR